MTIQLTVNDGVLYAGDSMLLRMYPAGDCDTCPWPMEDSEDARGLLAAALYDERETNDLFTGHVYEVLLPDGTLFNIDDNLQPTQPYEY